MRRFIISLLFSCFAFSVEKSSAAEKEQGLDIHADVFVTRNNIRAKNSGMRIPKIPTSGTNILDKLWELELDLTLNYKYKQSYTGIRLRLDNDMGSLGGTDSDLELIRLFMGYHFSWNNSNVNLEAGRFIRSDYFESKVMFKTDSYFDGLYLYSLIPFQKTFILETILSGFIVDWLTDHYGWAGQLSLEPYEHKGAFFKYTHIHWKKNGTTRIFDGFNNPVGFTKNNPRFFFDISQFLLEYSWESIYSLNLPCKVYTAYLINHAAKRKLPDETSLTGGHRENIAWYIGATIGKMTKPGTFSLDVNFQSVEAQAVPDFDSQGIGNGNPRSNLFYGPAVGDFSGSPVTVTQANANGNGNFKGWQFQLNYLFTRNISIQLEYQFSHPKSLSIGPDRSFQEFIVSSHLHW